MTLYLRSRLSTALYIENKEWLTLLVSIYRLVYTPPRGSVLHHSIIQVRCRDSLRWNEAKRFQYVHSHFCESDAKLLKNNQSLGTPGKYLHLIFEFNKNLRQLRLKINQDNFLDLTDTKQKRVN